MSIFKRQNPFHQEDVGTFKKPFGFWQLFLFVVIYAVVSMGGTWLVNQFIHVANTAFTVVSEFFGMQVGTYWLCRKFYKHTGRGMTQQEYRWSFWRVFLSLVIFHSLLGCLYTLAWFTLQAQCHGPSIGQPICHSAFVSMPIGVFLIIGVGLTLLINLCFIGFCFKTSLRYTLRLRSKTK